MFNIGDLISFTDANCPIPRMGRIESLADGGVNIAAYDLAMRKSIEFVPVSAIIETLAPSSSKAKAWKQLEKDIEKAHV